MVWYLPNGTDVENWSWSAVKAIEIPKEEQEKYKGETYRATDMSTIKYFEERDFIGCSFVYWGITRIEQYENKLCNNSM